jgi:hypothetical protein
MADLRGELKREMAGLGEDMRHLPSELSSFVRIFVAVTRLL